MTINTTEGYKVEGGPAQPVYVVNTAVPSSGGGDATAANQVTGNTSLSSIDSKTPALVGGATPVTGTVEVTNDVGNPLPVSGTLAVTKADGSDVAEGTTTDAAASSTVAESGTARTGISLWKGIKNILILLNAKFVAGTNIGVVGGTTIEVTDEFSRPTDTTAYAVGDAIGATTSNSGTTALRSLVVGAANGATGYITKIRMMTDQSTCVAVLRIHFYTVAAPATVIPGDNVATGLAYANRLQRIGAIDMPAMATELGTVTAARTQDLTTRLAFQCDPADNKIYYRLETQTIFTPANAQAFFIAVVSERNGA